MIKNSLKAAFAPDTIGQSNYGRTNLDEITPTSAGEAQKSLYAAAQKTMLDTGLSGEVLRLKINRTSSGFARGLIFQFDTAKNLPIAPDTFAANLNGSKIIPCMPGQDQNEYIAETAVSSRILQALGYSSVTAEMITQIKVNLIDAGNNKYKVCKIEIPRNHWQDNLGNNAVSHLDRLAGLG